MNIAEIANIKYPPKIMLKPFPLGSGCSKEEDLNESLRLAFIAGMKEDRWIDIADGNPELKYHYSTVSISVNYLVHLANGDIRVAWCKRFNRASVKIPKDTILWQNETGFLDNVTHYSILPAPPKQ